MRSWGRGKWLRLCEAGINRTRAEPCEWSTENTQELLKAHKKLSCAEDVFIAVRLPPRHWNSELHTDNQACASIKKRVILARKKFFRGKRYFFFYLNKLPFPEVLIMLKKYLLPHEAEPCGMEYRFSIELREGESLCRKGIGWVPAKSFVEMERNLRVLSLQHPKVSIAEALMHRVILFTLHVSAGETYTSTRTFNPCV